MSLITLCVIMALISTMPDSLTDWRTVVKPGHVLMGDVFSYCSDSLAQYDTDLRREHFMKTERYKNLTDSLQLIKKRLLNQQYTITLHGNFKTWDNKTGALPFKFEEKIASISGDFLIVNSSRFDINGVWLEGLPIDCIRREGELYDNEIYYDMILRVKANENQALVLERKHCEIRLAFYLTGEVHKHKTFLLFGYFNEVAPCGKVTAMEVSLDGEIIVERSYK